MTDNRNPGTGYILIISLVYIAFASGAGWFVYRYPDLDDRQLWQEYVPVLVDKEKFTRETAEELDSLFSSVHLYNSEVEFFNYNGMEKIALTSVQERFDKSDPRLDNYMSNLRNLFFSRSGHYAVIYVDTAAGPFSLYRQLRSVMEELDVGDWVIPELGFTSRFFQIGAFILFLAFVLMVFNKRRLFIVLSACPWFPGVFTAGGVLFPIAAFSVYITAWILEDIAAHLPECLHFPGSPDNNRLPLRSAAGAAALIAVCVIVFIFSQPEKMTLFTASAAFLADAALPLLLTVIIRARVRRQLHPRFFRIPLKSDRGLSAAGRNILRFLLCAGIITAVPVVVHTLPDTLDDALPVPAGADGHDHGSPEETDIFLPGIAAYRQHVRFQTGFLYTPLGTGETAEEGSGTTLPENYHVTDDGRIEPYYSAGEEVNGAADEKITAVAGMLQKQGDDSRILYKKSVQPLFKNSALIIYFLSSLIIHIPVLFFSVYLTPRRLYAMKAIELRSRVGTA